MKAPPASAISQQEIIASLPVHLRPFVQTQNYERYTARDQAVWRFIMKQLTRQLKDRAHPVYLEGLARTGISLDHIPSIDEMNASLAQLNWRAVVVDGFIPPAIFMEFQALKVLVIAVDMRSVDHILYTPAPDIVHESAGHAPFIVDVDYAEFLQRFGEIGMKAISSRADLEFYEAIRRVSILKECPGSTPREVEEAEAALVELAKINTSLSEASLLTRLHWWTVEYGLVGELDDYRIFGAGLLSSLAESRQCLDDASVRKLPLTVDAVRYPYDITRTQPQLFVTRSCRHLSQVLEEFAATMCFQRGGAESLKVAIEAATVCTAQYDSGVQVSGVFAQVLCDAVNNEIYLRTSGPTQLAWGSRELYGHGVEYHSEGFGSPIGHLKDFSRCLSHYSFDELKAHNIVVGEQVRLEYLSGITVQGRLRQIHRQEHRNLLLTFDECTVTDLAGRVLFDPAWGTYDMAVGSAIKSVYGGVADRESLQLHKPTPTTGTIRVPQDSNLMDLYARIARLNREKASPDTGLLQAVEQGLGAYPQEWLLRYELLDTTDRALRERAHAELDALRKSQPELAELIGTSPGFLERP